MAVFELYHREKQRLPLKVWLEKPEDMEPECLEQALRLSNLPFAAQHVALMPDAHAGIGMPIGGVFAADGVVVPNAVGVDIGCGMIFARTNIPVESLKKVRTANGTPIQQWVGAIMRDIPLGFAHHRKDQPCETLDAFQEEIRAGDPVHYPAELLAEIPEGYRQIGTLGGGNHFIELQEDPDGFLGIMIHSGSRNFGYKICRHFNDLARKIDKKLGKGSRIPAEWNLAFLPADTAEGQAYIEWMNLALRFAHENRRSMMARVQRIIGDTLAAAGLPELQIQTEINVHHNYAAVEEHFGRRLWIHRKGAIRARKGELCIIPGAMGGFSYIAEGLGNPESFVSCSHGAGRRMSRKAARDRFSVDEMLSDLNARGILLGAPQKTQVVDEFRKAYKDIDTVLDNERDLARQIMKLKPLCVIKG